MVVFYVGVSGLSAAITCRTRFQGRVIPAIKVLMVKCFLVVRSLPVIVHKLFAVFVTASQIVPAVMVYVATSALERV